MRVKRTNKGKGIVEVTEADYQAQLTRIKDEDAVLRPGRYLYERGGFKSRHCTANGQPDTAREDDETQKRPFD